MRTGQALEIMQLSVLLSCNGDNRAALTARALAGSTDHPL